MSYEAIGSYFDKKHTTVLYSCEQIAEKLDNNQVIKDNISAIKNIIKDF